MFLIAIATTLVTLVASGWYDYFGDELYFLAAGDHLAWGYADQQPVLPLLARIMDTVFPGEPLGLRVPSILTVGLGVVLSALIARELGGSSRAQVLSALAYATCPQFLLNARTLTTAGIDAFLWCLITWLLVRWIRLRSEDRPDDRLLLYVGVVTALAIQVKSLIIGFWATALLALVLVGPRSLLRRRLLWVGFGLSVLGAVPTLLWQSNHGWVQLGMAGIVSGENDFSGPMLVIRMVFVAGGAGAVLLCYGVYLLVRAPEFRPFRFLGIGFLFLVAIFLLVGAREYYVSGLYAVTWAVAAVDLEQRSWVRNRNLVWSSYLVSAIVAVSVLTPYPISPTLPYGTKLYNETSTDGRRLTDDVVREFQSLPPQQRRQSAVIATDYWSASAIHHYSPEIPVYSGSRGFWFFGQPPERIQNVIYVGREHDMLLQKFTRVDRVSSADHDKYMHNSGAPIWLAEGPKESWSELWPKFQKMGMW